MAQRNLDIDQYKSLPLARLLQLPSSSAKPRVAAFSPITSDAYMVPCFLFNAFIEPPDKICQTLQKAPQVRRVLKRMKRTAMNNNLAKEGDMSSAKKARLTPRFDGVAHYRLCIERSFGHAQTSSMFKTIFVQF